MKTNTTSRAPDCFQRTPRRINISENGGYILTIAVDGQGEILITINYSKLNNPWRYLKTRKLKLEKELQLKLNI